MSREKKPIVYVFNMLEDVLAFAKTLNKKARELEYRQCATWYTGRELLSFLAEYKDREEFYYVTPWKLDENYVNYACDLFGVKREQLNIIVPNQKLRHHNGSVSEDTLENRLAMEELPFNEPVDLTAYCMSEELYKLTHVFGRHAKKIDVTSKKNWENIKRLGTKSGIRELVEGLNDNKLVMPNGKIFYFDSSNIEDVIDYSTTKLMKGEGVVIKIDKAHGGVGVLLIKEDEVKDFDEFKIKDYLKGKLKEKYWNEFNVVVEDLIDIDITKHGGGPNIEVRVTDKGVDVLYVCGLRVEHEKDFVGVEFGKDVFSTDIERQLKYIGEKLGNEYFIRGYRGNFDVDCHIDKNGKIWIAESNIRRTGGTYAYNVAVSLFGKDKFNDHYYMTNSTDAKNVRGYDFNRLNSILMEKGIGFTKEKSAGVILTGPEALNDGVLNYMIIADNDKDAIKIERTLKEIVEFLPQRTLQHYATKLFSAIKNF